jgi:hypothetical protein
MKAARGNTQTVGSGVESSGQKWPMISLHQPRAGVNLSNHNRNFWRVWEAYLTEIAAVRPSFVRISDQIQAVM